MSLFGMEIVKEGFHYNFSPKFFFFLSSFPPIHSENSLWIPRRGLKDFSQRVIE